MGHANSTYRLRDGVTRRGRDNLICNVLSPRLEHIGTRCWLKLQPWIAYSAALLRVPCSRSLCHGFLFQIRTGIHSFSFFLTWKSTVTWKWKESSLSKWSIHSLSISSYLFCSGSMGPFMVIMGQRHKLIVQTLHRGHSLGWLTSRHCSGQKLACGKCRTQWKTPSSFAWLTWGRT